MDAANALPANSEIAACNNTIIFALSKIINTFAALKKCNGMTKRQNDIIIANPMYDVVFKLLMADKDIARHFVGTVLGEEITDIDFAPQEYSYEKEIQTENQIKKISIIRLDFVATIRTKDGEDKKILIEIQQSLKPYDILRFRTYIGEQYKNRNNIVAKDDEIVKVMPIVAIYMLGFKMEGASQVAVKVKRTGDDMINGGDVEIKNLLFDALTHDVYIIQVSRLKQEMFDNLEKRSELIQILSVFEQSYFVDKEYFKKYPYPITNKIIQKMINTLERIAVDPKMRRVMEEEEFAALDKAFWQDVVTRKDNAIAQKDKEIAELRRRLGLN
jgi:hypothetical protein